MKNRVIEILIIPLLLAGSSVGAQETVSGGEQDEQDQQENFDTAVAEAMRHYGAREYDEAVFFFERAYELQQEPDLVYNIARSHERLAHRQEALDTYERFIALPGTTGELRARALTNIRSLRAEIAAMEAVARDEANNTGDGNQGGTAAPPPPVEVEPESNPLSIVGYALIGVGAATMIAGAIFGGMALSANSQYEDAAFTQERISLRDDVETRAAFSDVFLFSGLGVAAVGVVLALVGSSRGNSNEVESEESARRFGVTPSLALGDGMGLGISGRF